MRSAGVVSEAGRAVDAERLAADALAREDTSPTGLPGGIAIPHCRTAGVTEPTLAFARLSPAVDFGAKDGPADIAFLIAAPDGGDSTHLKLLTKLARALVKPDFTAALREARSAAEVVELVGAAIGTTVPAARPPWPASAPAPARVRRPPHLPPSRGAGARRTPLAGRRDRLPHRHRPHLHGRRGAGGRCRAGRRRHRRRDPGLGRLQAAAPRHDRGGVGGHLRRRRRGPRPAAVRRQARGLLGREAPDRGGRHDDRRGPAVRRRPARAPRGGHRPRRGLRLGRQRVVGRPRPTGADDRRLLHDPVRRRRRPADRAQLPARRLRDRRPLRRHRGQAHDVRPAQPRRLRTRARAVRLRPHGLPRRAVLHHRQDRVRASSSRRSPATSPTPSPTARASRPAS